MKHLHVVGEFAFIIGIVLAVVVAFFSEFLNGAAISITLIALGFVIGLLSITDKESDRFLISSIALLIAGGAILQILPFLGRAID